MNALQEDTVSVLRDLISTLRNGQDGFRTASDNIAGDPELKRLLSSFSLQRAKFSGELEGQLVAMGESPEALEKGIGGALHRGWLHLKSGAISGDNHAILEGAEREEGLAEGSYNKALAHELPDPLRQILQRQRHEVLATRNTVRALRDAKPSEASAVVAKAHDQITESAKRLQTSAGEKWEQVKASSGKAREDVEHYVRKNPLPSLAGALVTGFGIGMIFYALELRNERARIESRAERGIGRFWTPLAASLGYILGQARSASSNAAETVRDYSSRAPLFKPQPSRGERLARPFRSAWNRLAGKS